MDAFIAQVSPMDKAGFFSCGTDGDYTIPTARSAKQLIVEVNPRMPRVFGDSTIHISDVEAIVEHESPLAELPIHPPNELDRIIGKFIVELVPDRAALQVGIGGVPNAVCLELVNHKDLGIHTELMTPALAVLIRSGAVTNKYKSVRRHKNVYTLAAGDREFYEFLNDNSSMELYPVDFVNDPNIIGQNARANLHQRFPRGRPRRRSQLRGHWRKTVQCPRRPARFRTWSTIVERWKIDPDRLFDRGQRFDIAHCSKGRGPGHRPSGGDTIHSN
jgi:acyl-CoA hydrolase